MAGISKKRVKTKKGEVVKYTITYYDIFGKQHTSGIYDTIKEAKKNLHKFDKKETVNGNVTYGDIFKSFLQRCENKCSYGTNLNYNNVYSRYLEKFNNIQYEKINSLEWQNYFDDLKENESPHTINYAISFARSACNYAIKHLLIENNVFNKVDKIKTPKADINHLTLKELRSILEVCKNYYPQYFALLYTFIGTGAREGEIFALTKQDFNPIEKTLKINKQFTRSRLFYHPKTQTSNRTIYLFNDLNEVLKEHIKQLPADCELLFPNTKGNYQHASNFRKRFFRPLLKLCGIEKRVRVHDLRGSYTDMTLSSGLSVKFTQNQLGHSKSQTTLDNYARNNNDMIELAMAKIDNIFIKKYEQNMSKKENAQNKNIIQFPKRFVDNAF